MFKPGELVEICSESEILATLDREGTLEGLPFMPEMRKYCGRRFKVLHNLKTILIEGIGLHRNIKDAVILEGTTCDGSAHMGCQRTCTIIWKDAWLKHVGDSLSAESCSDAAVSREALQSSSTDSQMTCQLTNLIEATSRVYTSLPLEFIVRYKRYLDKRKSTILNDLIWKYVCRSPLRTLGPFKQLCSLQGSRKVTPSAVLNLKPDEFVAVKSKEEITDTLDIRGRNRGLAFTAEMLPYCGQKYRVKKRVDKMIDETTKKMRTLTDTVILEGVTCDGCFHNNCPRNCYCLWREIWLKRV